MNNKYVLRQLERSKNRFESIYRNNTYPKVTEWQKITVSPICKLHGKFTVYRSNHMKGYGCPTCLKLARIEKSKARFLSKVMAKYGDKLNYSKVEYLDACTEVCIICPKHGEFYQKPIVHSTGRGCPKCYIDSITYNEKQWIKLAIDKHGSKYDYSNVVYTGSREKVAIICKEHGEFKQIASDHLLGNNCPKCASLNVGVKQRYTQEQVIDKFKQVHDNKYLYHLVEYVKTKRKVIIVCRKHGSFRQMPHVHMAGKGCPRCSESKGEKIIAKMLDRNNIKYIKEFSFNNSTWRYDFFLTELNTLIECDGMQHYRAVKLWGGVEGLRLRQKRDREKNKLAKENNMVLIRVQYNTITALVDDFIREMSKIYPYQLDSIIFSIHRKNGNRHISMVSKTV